MVWPLQSPSDAGAYPAVGFFHMPQRTQLEHQLSPVGFKWLFVCSLDSLQLQPTSIQKKSQYNQVLPPVKKHQHLAAKAPFGLQSKSLDGIASMLCTGMQFTRTSTNCTPNYAPSAIQVTPAWRKAFRTQMLSQAAAG